MVAHSQDNPKNRCPICDEPTSPNAPTLPFCSDRCRTIDLGKWLDGKYTISRPVEQDDLEQGD
jgi:uncharacterized protein